MSDVLTGMHVRSFGYARLEVHAPWGVSYPQHRASIGMLLEGNCWLRVGMGPDLIALQGGDCFLMVHGDAHALLSGPEVVPKPFHEVFRREGGVRAQRGDGPLGIVIGGWFDMDPASSRPLTKHLPPLIHIPARQARSLSLHTTMQQLAHETEVSAPGFQFVVNRLAEVLFVQMVRAEISLISKETPPDASWLNALDDPAITAALSLMHHEIDRPWTVQMLGDAVGLSRSAFSQRFSRLVGEPPLQYLTNWRMFRASEMLRGKNLKIAAVAASVGYDSEAAFSRVFKRFIRTSPGRFRQDQRSDT